MLQRFEDADLLCVGAVALCHGDVAAFVEKHVAQPPRVAKAAALGVPLRRDGQFAVVARDVDRGVVRCLDDCHLAALAIRDPPERHADAVAAIGNEPHRVDGLVPDGIGDALVHRNDEVFARLREKRRGKSDRSFDIAFRAKVKSEFRRRFFQADCDRHFQVFRDVK